MSGLGKWRGVHAPHGLLAGRSMVRSGLEVSEAIQCASAGATSTSTATTAPSSTMLTNVLISNGTGTLLSREEVRETGERWSVAWKCLRSASRGLDSFLLIISPLVIRVDGILHPLYSRSYRTFVR